MSKINSLDNAGKAMHHINLYNLLYTSPVFNLILNKLKLIYSKVHLSVTYPVDQRASLYDLN